MLKFKDLQNRVYSGKTCVRFECTIPIDKDFAVEATFKRLSSESNEWRMQIIFNRTRDKDSEVYSFGYVMPKDGIPLELIAATGLKYFQLYIKEEIEKKCDLDFKLGDVLQGM